MLYVCHIIYTCIWFLNLYLYMQIMIVERWYLVVHHYYISVNNQEIIFAEQSEIMFIDQPDFFLGSINDGNLFYRSAKIFPVWRWIYFYRSARISWIEGYLFSQNGLFYLSQWFLIFMVWIQIMNGSLIHIFGVRFWFVWFVIIPFLVSMFLSNFVYFTAIWQFNIMSTGKIIFLKFVKGTFSQIC